MDAEHAEAEKLPPIMQRHDRSEIRRAIPGHYGLGSASSPAEEAYLNRAYPDHEISRTQIERARSSYRNFLGQYNHGKKGDGQWVSVGPKIAEYQSTPYRNFYSYVPTKYDASGRTSALAISPNCTYWRCRVWVGAAGGGIWRTDDGLSDHPHWTFLSRLFEMNSIGTIVVDPNDRDGDTIWVGTGEANTSADSAAGVGIYKSVNDGDAWIGPLGDDVFRGRAVGTLAVRPGNSRILYAGTTRAVLGVTAATGGAVSLIPGGAMFGLYKSTDGGRHWTLIHDGSADVSQCTSVTFDIVNNTTACSPRGVRRVALDPSNPDMVYASSMGRGVWRSNDAGSTWSQVKPPVSATNAWRSEFSVAKLPNGVNGPPTIAPGGHVIEATYNPGTGETLFVDRSYDLGDVPITGVAHDQATGDVFAATDYGVLRLPGGKHHWKEAAPGLPRVEVAQLTIVPKARKLYAATHGLGGWLLTLDDDDNGHGGH